MPIILLLFYPIIEIILLIILASHIGLMATLLYIILSALFGSWMLRNQQLGMLLVVGSSLKQPGRASLYSLLWPLRYTLAGVLFIVPGVLSEIVAIILLLPLGGPRRTSASNSAPPVDENVIEGEFHRVEDPKPGITEPDDRRRQDK